MNNEYVRSYLMCLFLSLWFFFLQCTVSNSTCNKYKPNIRFAEQLNQFFLVHLPRPPLTLPLPRAILAGMAPPPLPISLNTATLLTDMEKFLCRKK